MRTLRFFIFFFNHTATTEIYTLSLHDALPIYARDARRDFLPPPRRPEGLVRGRNRDRKSTRLNSSHRCISYAVFCLKKKRYLIRLRQHHLVLNITTINHIEPSS